MRAVPLLAAGLALALAGCHRSESAPGGVTAAESKALDDAAEMIEKQRLPQEALRAPAPQQSSAPAAAK